VLLPVVRALTDPVEQDHYMLAIADTIGVSQEALLAKFKQGKSDEIKPLRRAKTTPQAIDKQLVEDAKVRDRFLALTLMQPKLRDFLDIMEPNMLQASDAKKLLEFLRTHQDFGGKPEEAKSLSPLAEYVKIIALQYEELYQGLEYTELRYEAARLQTRLVEQYVKQRKKIIAAQLDDTDEETTRTLLDDAKQLDALLNRVKGR